MRASELFMPTLREVPAEAEVASHRLMLRAALMRKVATGVYSYLPLGLRTLKKVENIVRQEMDRAGAQELLMPAILPAESYKESGRWEVFGPEMFRLTDRNARDYCLGPTHEETFTETVRNDVQSYRSYPFTLYQIQAKYRDERRPRFGVLRSREFLMKDAYSFDINEAGLDESYKKMHNAYCRIFDRLGLDYTVVAADSGAMGGSGSQEFMVKSEIGEAIIAFCESCGYAANDEKAECIPQDKEFDMSNAAMELVETPDARTIEDLTNFFNTKPYVFAKTLIYRADDKFVAAMVRGDRELNETKLQNALRCTELELASPDDVVRITNAAVGFAGPIGLDIPVYADKEVANMHGFIVGANKTGYHYNHVEYGRDFTANVLDLRTIVEGDVCPCCGKSISTAAGIEVGHIFKLGTKYAKALGLNYLDENGEPQTVIMGSYGIGINRCVAAVIEQNSDDDGIIWPVTVAPYHVAVVPVKYDDPTQKAVADEIYEKLTEAGVEVLIDDRDERAGVKFKDMDLIGIPVRITVGKKAAEGTVEYKLRRENDSRDVTIDDAIASALEFIKSEMR